MSSGVKTYEKRKSVKNSVWRLLFVAVAIVAEVTLMIWLILSLDHRYTILATVVRALALILVIGIFRQEKSSSVKMPWIVLILLTPVVGVTIYLMVGLSGSTHAMRKRFLNTDEKLFPLLQDDSGVMEKFNAEDRRFANIFRYLSEKMSFPVYDDTDVEFFQAAEGIERQKKELMKAEKFIFMEYHAIEDAESFAGIREILAMKAAEGVEVRILYDDMGSIGFINRDFIRRMEDVGVRCRVFNPVVPFVNVFLNNRDHRKITVIDGRIGFTGGYNLANEYFGVTRPYGRWKDTGVMLTGSAVRSLTLMFLEMWNSIKGRGMDDVYYDLYMPEIPHEPAEHCYVQPFGDTPLDTEHVGENVYINMVNAAQDYVWFITPYLIITDEMNRALTLAASRGVDVRIVVPAIPDKKLIFSVTKSYCPRLARDGVRIFEYTPGFCHAKQCIVDGRAAFCGTINLDYRSLYHHFENGALIYGGSAVDAIREDFEKTFDESLEVTERCLNVRPQKGVLQSVLRLFSPLL